MLIMKPLLDLKFSITCWCQLSSATICLPRTVKNKTRSAWVMHVLCSFPDPLPWELGSMSQMKVKVTQLCLALCNSKDYTVNGILQSRILEWISFPFSRGFSQPRDWTQVSCIAGRLFTSWATREAQKYWSRWLTLFQHIFPTQESNGVSCVAGGFFTNWVIREAQLIIIADLKSVSVKSNI